MQIVSKGAIAVLENALAMAPLSNLLPLRPSFNLKRNVLVLLFILLLPCASSSSSAPASSPRLDSASASWSLSHPDSRNGESFTERSRQESAQQQGGGGGGGGESVQLQRGGGGDQNSQIKKFLNLPGPPPFYKTHHTHLL